HLLVYAAIEREHRSAQAHAHVVETPGNAAACHRAAAARRDAAHFAGEAAETRAERACVAEPATTGGECEGDAAGEIWAHQARINAGRTAVHGPAFRRRPRHDATGARMTVEEVNFRGHESEAVLAEGTVQFHRHLGQVRGAAARAQVHLVRQDALQGEGARRAAHRHVPADERPAEVVPAAVQVKSRSLVD